MICICRDRTNQENGPDGTFPFWPDNIFACISVKFQWLCWQNPVTVIIKPPHWFAWRFNTFYIFFPAYETQKKFSYNWRVYRSALLAHFCQRKGGTLQLKDSIRELKWKGRIDASLETPAVLMYIQEYRKKVTNLLKICQMAFNHGAMGHPANREQRSKPSSGAISLESLWRSALLEFNLLCHRVRIHSGGQIFQRDSKQSERHPVFTKNVLCCWKASSPPFHYWWCLHSAFPPRFKPCYPPFRGNHWYLFIFKVSTELKEYFAEFPKETMYCSLKPIWKQISKLLNSSRSKSTFSVGASYYL